MRKHCGLCQQKYNYFIKDIIFRNGAGEIMGGKILKLRSEELLEQGEARGRLTGLNEAKIDAIQNMIDLGLTREQILRKYSPEEYEEAEPGKSALPIRNYSQIYDTSIIFNCF